MKEKQKLNTKNPNSPDNKLISETNQNSSQKLSNNLHVFNPRTSNDINQVQNEKENPRAMNFHFHSPLCIQKNVRVKLSIFHSKVKK